MVVEYESDTELGALLEEGEIEEFTRREVLPCAPDAWVDEEATKVGHEMSFARYVCKPQTLRTPQEVRADIVALEGETEGPLKPILE